MGEQVISLATIAQQARDAAKIYSDVNDACPYPFFTDAGQAFKREFNLARQQMDANAAAGAEVQQ